MAVPVFLQPAFNYLQTVGVTDVSATITRIISQAVALGWSNPGAGQIQSPANSVGQYINLVFTRVSAQNLQMVFTDSYGRTFTRRCQVPNPMTERLYLNTFGCFFDPGNGEGLWGSIMDLSPELQDCHDQAFVGHGFRTAGDADDSHFDVPGSMQLDSSNPRVYVPQELTVLMPRGGLGSIGNCLYSQASSRMWYPCSYVGPVNGSVQRYRGRTYQALFVSDFEPTQSEIVVPLDQATTGVFKLLAFRTATTLFGSNVFRYRMAVRKS